MSLVDLPDHLTPEQRSKVDARRAEDVRLGGGDPDGTYAARRAALVQARATAAAELRRAHQALDDFDMLHEHFASRGRNTALHRPRR